MNKKHNLSTFLGTLFFIGLVPFAPGTFGSLASYGIYLLLPGWLYDGSYPYLLPLILVALTLVAVRICKKAEEILGEDHGSIVLDELVGYFVATLFLPHNWLIGLYAFILFRVFDIAKPFPIYRSQKLRNGWGVVIDDVLAGVYANVVLQILILIFPKFFKI
ncbi:MAG: phosphatidylglycerophosphatase A [Candidatus Cloacimonetes bacterium]|jgi:phosphatidylglycerophosphatase A|nr:phosphatidylglycerophosphatase A [Candidatus Cloacimonadota bacterium]MDD2422904.1 phosphatidylglycerophosphatase A [Candidatus Cloacimonadota bacterium]MDD4278080.1 phosphatidylglycerophosphatase A [Candidatus Cloacimonadota bacterium]MDY0325236.1 phosphatidylglycerophosphatase A [Candidatus Cloacimonadaceae bacterium]